MKLYPKVYPNIHEQRFKRSSTREFKRTCMKIYTVIHKSTQLSTRGHKQQSTREHTRMSIRHQAYLPSTRWLDLFFFSFLLSLAFSLCYNVFYPFNSDFSHTRAPNNFAYDAMDVLVMFNAGRSTARMFTTVWISRPTPNKCNLTPTGFFATKIPAA